MSDSLLSFFSSVPDPRVPGLVNYPLEEVLLTVFTGLLCRGEDLEEIEDICEEHLEWLRQYYSFSHGIAPAQTLRRVLARLEPRALEQAFLHWLPCLQERVRGVVAIDGKTVRGSKQEADGSGALHLLSAYAHETGLVLAQQAVDGKSNEITAIPDLLKQLNLEGAIVTIDAMGTQKEIARAIVGKKADYVLALKGNQGALLEDVKLFFDDPVLVGDSPRFETVESGHGRIERRTCVVADAAWMALRHPAWKALTSIVAATTDRTNKKTGKTSTETRFYITSLPQDAQAVAYAIRSHWSIENRLHWVLDVAFREDESRIRKDHAPRNLATIRRIVLNLARTENSKISIKNKRLKAVLNDAFREKLIAGNNR